MGLSDQTPTIQGATDGTEIGNINNNLKTTDVLTTGGLFSNLVVGVSAVEVKVGASRLVNRRSITIIPIDADMYWGYSSAITTSNGTPIFKSQLATFKVDDSCQIWIIASAASKNARITESP